MTVADADLRRKSVVMLAISPSNSGGHPARADFVRAPPYTNLLRPSDSVSDRDGDIRRGHADIRYWSIRKTEQRLYQSNAKHFGRSATNGEICVLNMPLHSLRQPAAAITGLALAFHEPQSPLAFDENLA